MTGEKESRGEGENTIKKVSRWGKIEEGERRGGN